MNTREIKFRAWDKSQLKMWFNVQNAYDTLGYHDIEDQINDGGDRGDFYPDNFGEALMDEDLIVMQYTGLKDKNGKNIYEGDIVVLSINGEKPLHKGVVEYLPPKFFVMDAKKSGLILTSNYEVVGNIYENSELLNSHE